MFNVMEGLFFLFLFFVAADLLWGWEHVAHVLGLCGPRGATLNHLDPVVSLARRPCNVITKQGFIVMHWLLLLQEGILSPLKMQVRAMILSKKI